MAEAIVSGVLKKLGEFISTQAKEKFDLLTGLETEIHNLFDTLKRIQAVLDDAEKRQFKDKIVELWLHNLEDISYEIDDVIDEWNYLIRKEEIEGPSWLTRVCSFIPFSCFFKVRFVRPDIAVNVKKLNERLDSIKREQDQFRFITSSPIASSSQEFTPIQSTSILPKDPEMIGRDSELDKLVSQLLYESHQEEKNIIKILSIVGPGGIGKTTLAQLAYNDARLNGPFEKTGWVCVSNTFDVIRVAKAIVESLDSSPVQNFGELDSLLQLVKNSTSGKRFLLVLDDVWLEDQMVWEPFKNSLSYGAPGSRILLTTRNKKVATNVGAISMIELGIMSPSDSWSLFHQIVFVGPNATGCERLENIGKEIAEKCQGLPLAIKVIASFLRCKNNVEDWLNVKDSELWKLEVTNVEIFPHLYLSYNDLSPVLRRCFSFCAVFRKGQLIHVDDLIRCWIALGYLESSESEDKMEVEGRDYFEILASRLFFVPSGEYNHERIMYYRMHDMVHDFALHLTKRERLVIEGSKVVTCCEKPRHVTWLPRYLQPIDTLPECNMGQARSFFGKFGYARTVVTKSLMNSLKLVRLLNLSWCSLELPAEIGNLIHLRFLILGYNDRLKELPATVYNLYNLHTLVLEGCEELKELPPGIEKLKKLRHLIVDKVKFPMGIEELTCLQTLSCFSIGREYNKLGHLKNLNQLRGSLEVWIMDGLEDAIDAQNANLKSKKHIQNLEFRIENSSRVTEGVMKALEPHPKLQKLKFYSYGEPELPQWITSLNNLVELGLYDCFSLEEWEDISAEDVEDNTVSLMPCLQRLIINYCPNLQTLPHRLLQKASSLSCIMLDKKEYNPSIFLLIASTLAEVKAREPNHQSTSTQEGPQVKPIHPALRPLIYSNDEGVLKDGCLALSYFVSHVTYGKAMIEAGVCQGIVELLRHRSPHVLIPALNLVEYILNENDALIQCIIDNDILPCLLSLLTNNSEESTSNMTIGERAKIQFHAAQALRIIAPRISEKRKVLIDLGVVPILVNLLRSPTDDVRGEVVLALGIFAGDSPECRDLLLGHEALMPLLLQLSEDANANLSMQINVTRTLCEFFKHKPQPQFEQVKPAVVVLSRLIYSNDEKVLYFACCALLCLVSGTCDKIQTMIEDSVCQRFAELLRHPAPVLDPVLRTIGVIVRGNNAQIQAVIEAGLIAPLVNLLQTAEYNMKNGAAWVISNAIRSGTHEQIKFMASEICIKSLCDHLVSLDSWAIIACLRGLKMILEVGEVEKIMGNSGDVNYFAQLIEKAEGLEKIKNLQFHDDNKVHKTATKILQTYWLGDEDETLP